MTDQPPRPTVARPTAFWGSIQAAAAQRQGVAGAWANIRAQAASQNITWPGGERTMFDAVNQMYSLAARNRNTSEALARADRGDYITQSMVGAQIFTRPAIERSVVRNFRVDFTVTVQGSQGPRVEHYHLAYTDANIPNTVGELRDDLLAYTAGLGDQYGLDVGDFSDVFIGEW